MKFRITRKALIALLAAAALGGAGVAVAATSGSGSSSPRQKYIDDVARHLGVSPSALSAAMQAAEIDRIDEAVAAGRLSKTQGEQLKQRIKEGKGPWFRGRFGPGPRGAGAPAAVHSYLGLSPATIHSQRRAGKSLAQIADATPGKSAQGLKKALEDAIKSRLDTAVSQGRITKAQQEKLLGKLSTRVEALINRKGLGPRGPLGPGHRRHGGPGWGGGAVPGSAPGAPPPAGPALAPQAY